MEIEIVEWTDASIMQGWEDIVVDIDNLMPDWWVKMQKRPY